MANNSQTQQALAADPKFQSRLRSNISNVAWQVINEDPETPLHQQREDFARLVINQVEVYARQFAPWIVERPNLIQFETSYDFAALAVVTAAGDPDIQSQLMADWNDIGGIAPQPPNINPGAVRGPLAPPMPRMDPAAPAPPSERGDA